MGVGSFSHEIERDGDGRVVVQLVGAMGGAEIKILSADLMEYLDGDEGPEGILFDLSEVEACDLAARQEMVEVQRLIAARGSRTAYLASRPRIRGVTLWIVHISQDGNARPIVSADEAEDWLDQRSTRMELIESEATRITTGAVKARKTAGRTGPGPNSPTEGGVQ